MGLTIKPYSVIRSTLDACFFWKQKEKKIKIEHPVANYSCTLRGNFVISTLKGACQNPL